MKYPQEIENEDSEKYYEDKALEEDLKEYDHNLEREEVTKEMNEIQNHPQTGNIKKVNLFESVKER